MTIGEMHVWFRQYAQQMGMQNVRAILPEQIDLLINTSITDTINQLIRENIGITNDRIITDNSKIGQINAFSTLYKVAEEDATSFNKGNDSYFESINKSIKEFDEPINYMFLVDLAIKYIIKTSAQSDAKISRWYPIRHIDDAYLADTLNDFILAPKFRSPVATIYNEKLEIFVDSLDNELFRDAVIAPELIRISYIAKPAKVKYYDDVNKDKSVDCNLPPSMHVDILKHAVDLYRISVSGALSTSQQQQQAQQQEDARNNYRNEGTQQR